MLTNLKYPRISLDFAWLLHSVSWPPGDNHLVSLTSESSLDYFHYKLQSFLHWIRHFNSFLPFPLKSSLHFFFKLPYFREHISRFCSNAKNVWITGLENLMRAVKTGWFTTSGYFSSQGVHRALVMWPDPWHCSARIPISRILYKI